ncbi:MAG: alpha-amylase family glycosyl hydrolase, partial [Flavisolibacter sp.]
KGSMGSYYACSDYTSVSPEFGSLEDFRELVQQAHKLEFKIILDWVANHTGWDHVWTKQHPDWYEHDEATGNFKRASGMDDIIELDFKNSEMRKAMTEAMKFWVRETGIDGFRCDLAFWVELDYWLEAIPEINQLRSLLWLAESDPLENPGYMQVFDAAYSWTWMHKTAEWYAKKLPLSTLKEVLQRYQEAPGIKAWFTSNHDENSWNGTEYEKYGFAAKALAVHSCTWPGIPLLYSGQELPNHKRLKFFDKDPIEWTGSYELHDFYKTLLQLRFHHPAVHASGEVLPLSTSEDQHVLAYKRKKGDDEVLVVLNLSEFDVHTQIKTGWQGTAREIFSDTKLYFTDSYTLDLASWQYAVYVREKT